MAKEGLLGEERVVELCYYNMRRLNGFRIVLLGWGRGVFKRHRGKVPLGGARATYLPSSHLFRWWGWDAGGRPLQPVGLDLG